MGWAYAQFLPHPHPYDRQTLLHKGQICSRPRGGAGSSRDAEDGGWAAAARSITSRKSHPLHASHGLRQLPVTFPQEASSPFPSNQVLGNVLSVLEKAGKGEGTRASQRAKLKRAVATAKFCPLPQSPHTVGFPGLGDALPTHPANTWGTAGSSLPGQHPVSSLTCLWSY